MSQKCSFWVMHVRLQSTSNLSFEKCAEFTNLTCRSLKWLFLWKKKTCILNKMEKVDKPTMWHQQLFFLCKMWKKFDFSNLPSMDGFCTPNKWFTALQSLKLKKTQNLMFSDVTCLLNSSPEVFKYISMYASMADEDAAWTQIHWRASHQRDHSIAEPDSSQSIAD